MGRFEGGWIKLHRKLTSSDIGRNGYCLAITVTLFMWANRHESTVRWNGRPRTVPKGSLVIGLRELAEHLGFSKDTVHRQLKYLASRDTIKVEPATEGTLVTILNFEDYQDAAELLRQAIGQGCDEGKDADATRAGHDAGRYVGHEPTPNGEVRRKEEKKKRRKEACDGSQGPSAISQVWSAYRDAFANRHGDAPPWNATIAGQLKNFVKRIPASEAPQVAAFYVTHNDAFYVKSMHPVGLLLKDAEKLRTEWVTGMRMTSQKAKNAETQDYHSDQLRRIAEGKL